MKEIGGYIEFEHYHGSILHESAVALNCGRNCLVYLIRAKRIKKILLPYFLCDSVKTVCQRENVEVRFYRIDSQFMPYKVKQQADEWLYVVNFYGQLLTEHIESLQCKYSRIILDQTQAYFQIPPNGIDALYTCRKFFGVADGAFLYTDVLLQDALPQDESFTRMRHLLGRYERNASEFYQEFSDNDQLFDAEPLKRMSKLTENLLRGIDYEAVRMRRTENFRFLAQKLDHFNLLRLNTPREGAFAYPLWVEHGAMIRKMLIAKKVYIPTLWPNVLQEMPEDSLEYRFASDILPLPVDQRYSEETMSFLAEVIQMALDERKGKKA